MIGLRRRINLRDQRGDVLAVLGLEIELAALDVGDELRVLHRRAEGVAQHLQPVRRQVGRRDERPADVLPGVEKFQHLLLFGVARQRQHVRHALQLGPRLGAGLEQHIDDLVRNPIGLALHDAVEAFADAVDLAALHRQKHIDRGAEARHELELVAEQIVQHLRIRARAGARPGVTQYKLVCPQVVGLFHLRGAVGDAGVVLPRRTAEPGHFGGVEARARRIAERAQRGVAGDDAEHRAVLRRGAIDMACRDVAARPRHVLRHDAGLARQVLADVPRHGAAPQIVTAARPEADHQRHALAAQVLRRRGLA